MPAPPEKYFEKIGQTVKYPTNARRNNIQGSVFVEFTVNSDGTVSDFLVKKSVNAELDKEALRALMSLNEPWTPGKKDGKAVATSMVLPISFKLD